LTIYLKQKSIWSFASFFSDANAILYLVVFVAVLLTLCYWCAVYFGIDLSDCQL